MQTPYEPIVETAESNNILQNIFSSWKLSARQFHAVLRSETPLFIPHFCFKPNVTSLILIELWKLKC